MEKFTDYIKQFFTLLFSLISLLIEAVAALVKLIIRFFKWLNKMPLDMRVYANYLHCVVWGILYKHDSRLPTQRPIVENDLKRNIGVDTIVFTTLKKSTASLPKDDLRETETILREFINMELYPADELGNLIPTALTQNSISITLEKCEDRGLYFQMLFKITENAQEVGTSTECREVPPPRDDTL
jgi:hypothetical protein